MTQLTLVRGLPGSGKTTFATSYADTQPGPHILVAADDYFTDDDGNYNWDPSRIKQAHRACQERTISALEHGTSVIVHNTFTTKWEFEPYLSMMDRGGGKPGRRVADVTLTVFNVYDGGLTDEQLAERNVHGVPLHSIQKMRHRWVPCPVPEIHVHFAAGFAYWQFPTTGWVPLEVH